MDILSSETVNYKLCAKCNTLRPDSQFWRNNDWCKKCIGRIRRSLPKDMKLCTKCKEIKPRSEFSAHKVHGKMKMQSECAICDRAIRRAAANAKYTPLKGRDNSLRQNHGITLTEYEVLLEKQGGLCAACKGAEKNIHYRTKRLYPLAVDHDHETGRVRALLCQACNRALGFLREDPERVLALLRYIYEYVQHPQS